MTILQEPPALSRQATHRACLDFIEHCAPSDGLIHSEAWEAAGCPALGSSAANAFVVPPAHRRIRHLSLEERRASGNWDFASSPGGVVSIEASHAAVEALHAWGDLDRLSQTDRLAWADALNAHQDEASGWYSGPYMRPESHPSWRDHVRCTHPWSHMQDHLVSCLVPTLLLLGSQPRIPLSAGRATGRFLDPHYLRSYLGDRDWSGYRGDGDYRRHNPWWMGNEFWYAGCQLWAISVTEADSSQARLATDLLHDVWFAWHDRNFNRFGFWDGAVDATDERRWRGRLKAYPHGLPMPQHRDEWNWLATQIMGGAHQLWLYEALDHPIPDGIRQAQTDVLLGLQHHRDHRFGLEGPATPASDSNDCTDVDCLTLLANNASRSDYRRADIAKACERAAASLLRDRRDTAGLFRARPNEAWTHHPTSYECFSPADAANLHQQSFSLWALRAALSTVTRSDDALVADFLGQTWGRTPYHWLYVPVSSPPRS